LWGLLRDSFPAGWRAQRKQIARPGEGWTLPSICYENAKSCRLLGVPFTAGGTGEINARVAARVWSLAFGDRV